MAAVTTSRGVVGTKARLSGLKSDQEKPWSHMRRRVFRSLTVKASSSQRACAVTEFFLKMRHSGACLDPDENYSGGRIVRAQSLIPRKARPACLGTHGAQGRCTLADGEEASS